jgi:ornithine--oxo-acid transaminase
MDVFKPGDHGSTYGGYPIAAAVGLVALDMLADGRLVRRSAELGDYLKSSLQSLKSPAIKEVRGRGLFVGIEIEKSAGTAGDLVLALLKAGVLTNKTHRNTVRMAPPFTIERDEIDQVVDRLARALAGLEAGKEAAS